MRRENESAWLFAKLPPHSAERFESGSKGGPISRQPPFAYWASLVGIGAALPIAFIGTDLLVRDGTRLPGRDFAGFWAAGHLAVRGDPAAAYDSASITATLSHLGVSVLEPFVYPPTSLLIVAPFGLLPYWPALMAWTIVGATLFAWTARRLLPFSTVLALLTPAALLNVWDGQFGFFFGALWLFVFRFGPNLAGAAAGLASFKPTLAIMLLPRLVRSPRTLVIAGLTTAIFGLVTFPLWPLFISAGRDHLAFVASADRSSFFFRMMPGPYETYGMSWIAQAGFTIAAIAVLIRFRCTDPFALATAAFLIVPYAHNYDMTVESLGCLIAMWAGWSGLSLLQRGVLSCGYLAPALTFLVPYAVPPILLAALYLQARGLHLTSSARAGSSGGNAVPIGDVHTP